MNRKNNYQMLTRVVDFLTRNVSLFPKSSAATEMLGKLESGVKTLSEAAAARKSAEAAMREAHTARATSRDHAKDVISRAGLVARALGNDKVRLPSKGTEQELIDVG